MNIKKLLLTITLLTQLLFSATSEQIEQYILVSNAEEELLSLETQFSSMQNGFKEDKNASKNKTYDTQLITVRFKEYLEKHLSDDEMDKILANYKNVILLQYVSAYSAVKSDRNATDTYITKLKAESDADVRIGVIEKITKIFYSQEAMTILFDELMLPLMQNGKSAVKLDDKSIKKMRTNYLKNITKSASKTSVYILRDFSLEELEELLKIAQTPATNYETKAVYGATAYALKEFFLSITSRYDVNKHKAKPNSNTK